MKFIKQEETKPFNDAENLPNNTETGTSHTS